MKTYTLTVNEAQLDVLRQFMRDSSYHLTADFAQELSDALMFAAPTHEVPFIRDVDAEAILETMRARKANGVPETSILIADCAINGDYRATHWGSARTQRAINRLEMLHLIRRTSPYNEEPVYVAVDTEPE
jgi:hypothetical protein